MKSQALLLINILWKYKGIMQAVFVPIAWKEWEQKTGKMVGVESVNPFLIKLIFFYSVPSAVLPGPFAAVLLVSVLFKFHSDK